MSKNYLPFLILGIGFLLTVSLVLSGAISALGKYFFADMEAVLQVANFVVSFGVITLASEFSIYSANRRYFSPSKKGFFYSE